MPGVQRFVVAVAALLLDDSGRVLLIREAHGDRQYGLPGALVQEYESPEETLVREAALQADISIAIDDVVGVKYRVAEPHSLLLVVYRCRRLSGVARVTQYGDIAEVGWYPTDELPTPMHAAVRPAIAAGVAGGQGVVFDELPVGMNRRRRFHLFKER